MPSAIGKYLKRLFGPYQWPKGQPLMSAGVRWGTRTDDGMIILAPGVEFTPLPICSVCQKAIEAEGDQQHTKSDKSDAQQLNDARVARE